MPPLAMKAWRSGSGSARAGENDSASPKGRTHKRDVRIVNAVCMDPAGSQPFDPLGNPFALSEGRRTESKGQPSLELPGPSTSRPDAVARPLRSGRTDKSVR